MAKYQDVSFGAEGDGAMRIFPQKHLYGHLDRTCFPLAVAVESGKAASNGYTGIPEVALARPGIS